MATSVSPPLPVLTVMPLLALVGSVTAFNFKDAE